MAGSRALAALVIALFVASAVDAGSATPAKADGAVTCGSVITLKGSRVGSTVACQEVAYGGQGSGQMACTGVTGVSDPNRYFTIRGVEGKECLQGEPIAKGAKVRLQNKVTGRWLHTHRVRSMLSGGQEVSCFGSETESDDSDVWKVTWSGGGKHWSTKDKVTLQHDVTGAYLAAMPGQYPNPLTGQKEIAGLRTKQSETLFEVAEGIYFPQRENKVPAGKKPTKPKVHSEL
ncbi:stromal cell-derived factor 2-like protein [Chloropicon roscoffensis]|uniref:Stromal cell-derived factor 2-like protein n=2 Tax=Chloropicon roscoffensis TaxID=1461544 RepID=A0AAX4PAQ8_9CHLO